MNDKTNTDLWQSQFDAVPFSKVSSNEWYAVSDDDGEEAVARRAEAKRLFLEDDTLREPALPYPRIEGENRFDREERVYQSLLNSAITDEQYQRAAKRLAQLYRHKEVARGIGAVGARHVLSKERASNMAMEIFGEPRERDVHGMLGRLREQASELTETVPEAAELLGMMGEIRSEGWINQGVLRDETLHTLEADLETLYPGINRLLADIPDKGAMDPEETKRAIESTLDFFGLSEKGWQVKLIPRSKVMANTNSATKTISLGEERARFSSKQLRKTAFHEVMGHALPSEGGGARENVFEEAWAVCLEQIMTGEQRAGSGEQYYTSIGLQLGMDRGGRQRDFRETFEIMWRRQIVLASAKGEVVSREQARDKAFTEVYRTRRGGAIDTRDMSYFEGSQIVPTCLNELAERPEEERRVTLRSVLISRINPFTSTE